MRKPQTPSRTKEQYLPIEALVRERMERKGIKTLIQLSKLAGVGGSNISQMLLGKKSLSKAAAAKLGLVLDCDTSHLLETFRASCAEKGPLQLTAERLQFYGKLTPALAPFIREPFSPKLLELLWFERRRDTNL